MEGWLGGSSRIPWTRGCVWCGIWACSALEVDEDSSDTSVRPGLPQAFLAWIHSEMVHITPREVLAEQLGTLDENVILLNVFFLLRLKKKNPANLAFSLQFLPLVWEAGPVLMDGLSTCWYRDIFSPPWGDKALPGFSGWPFLALQGPLPYLFVKNLTRIPRNTLDFIQYETDSCFLEFSLLFFGKGNQEINASVYVWNKDWTRSFSKFWLPGHFSSAPIWSMSIRQTV